MAMDIQKEYAMLQQQVKKCMQTNMPFDKYVKRQMQLVEQVKDEFVKNIHISAYEIYSLTISSIFRLSLSFPNAPNPGVSIQRNPNNVKYCILPVVSKIPTPKLSLLFCWLTTLASSSISIDGFWYCLNLLSKLAFLYVSPAKKLPNVLFPALTGLFFYKFYSFCVLFYLLIPFTNIIINDF